MLNRLIHAVRSMHFLIPANSSFYNDKINDSKKYIHTMILVTGLINIMLLVPDLIMSDGTSKISIVIIRAVFSIILFGFSIQLKAIRSFKILSVYITLCEIVAFIVFLFVLSQYSQPNFLIQTMGVITIIIIIFFIPNRWIYMLMAAVFGLAGFFICSIIFIPSVSPTEFCAAVVYVLIAVLICALSAWNSDQHQFKEFEAKRELERLSSTDFLTNTANRYKLEEEAARWMGFCRRQGFPLSLVFIDVDNLKTINDQYGHAAGDSVLEQLAPIIQSHLRSSDIVARWGGDEFILLLPNITFDHAIAITERARNSIRESTFRQDIHVTCSFGVVEMKKDSTFETMISQADKLMYDSKAQGKDTVQWTQ